MNDYRYLYDMELEYSNIIGANNEIESKAYNMIAISGVLLGLQGTLLSNYPFNSIWITILFLLPLLAFLISIYFFIKNLLNKQYQFIPSSEGVVKYYEENYSEEEYISTMLGNYDWAINFNLDVLSIKSEYNKKGLICFLLGLIFLGLFFVGFMIL